MKLTEQFSLDESPATVWRRLQDAEFVASCVPGMESVQVDDADNVRVRVSQRIGPMSATFDAKVKVLARVEEQLIRFEAVGKSVRGAVGNVRSLNVVTLEPVGTGTAVHLEGDVVLGGALGSVGQKVVAKQTGKVTEQFVANLRAGIAGELPFARAQMSPRSGEADGRPLSPLRTATEHGSEAAGALAPAEAAGAIAAAQLRGLRRWCAVAALASGASCVLSTVVLVRLRRNRT